MIETLVCIISDANFRLDNCYKKCYNISDSERRFLIEQIKYLNELLQLELEVTKS